MIINGTNLKMTRGDSEKIVVFLKGYSLQQGDMVEFTVRESIYSDKPVIYKKITEFSDNSFYINILPEDTESLLFGKYVYDVKLTFNGMVKTIIRISTFTIGEEVTYRGKSSN